MGGYLGNFLANVNHTVGDSMRFVKQYNANPEQFAADAAANSPAAQQGNQLNSILLLLVFQMMMQFSGQGGGGITFPDNPFPTPVFPPFPVDPQLPPNTNPALQSLDGWLKNSTVARPDVIFEDNASVQKRLDQIFTNAKDPQLTAWTAQLKTLDPDSEEAVILKANITNRLSGLGATDDTVKEVGLLWSTQRINSAISGLGRIEAPPGPEADQLKARIDAMKAQRDQLKTYWTGLFPADPVNAGITAKVQDALAKGQFTREQLGQALKYELDKAPDSALPAVQNLIANLMDTGDLSVAPFLQNDYLDKLVPKRRDALLAAVESAGLRMDNGKPNARFIGFILDNLGRANQPQTQTFLRKFLQDFYNVHGSDPTTPVGKILAEVLDLAGVSADAQKKLVFS